MVDNPTVTDNSELQKTVADGRKRAVDHLQRLYGVVVGLAVTELLKRLFLASDNTIIHPCTATILMSVTFIATLVPFYHGANRYLDMAYVTGERPARHTALIVDFLFLVSEAVLFFILAESTQNPFVRPDSTANHHGFYTICMILFALDAIWISTTYFTIDPARLPTTQPIRLTNWIIFSVVSLVIVGLCIWSRLWPNEELKIAAVAVFAVLRTIIDYIMMWKSVYFPPDPA